MAENRPKQPAYEISSIECRFYQSNSEPSRIKEGCANEYQRGVPF